MLALEKMIRKLDGPLINIQKTWARKDLQIHFENKDCPQKIRPVKKVFTYIYAFPKQIMPSYHFYCFLGQHQWEYSEQT